MNEPMEQPQVDMAEDEPRQRQESWLGPNIQPKVEEKKEQPAAAAPPAELPAEEQPVAEMPQPPIMPPPGAPPEWVAPIMHQNAQTQQTIQQLAALQAQQMAAQMPRPPEPPKPDPIEQPEEFAQYMFEKQFAPLQQQYLVNTAYMLKQSVKNQPQFRDFQDVEPLVDQMASRLHPAALAQPGTWETLYYTAKGFMGQQAVNDFTVPPPHAQTAAPHVQRFPEAKAPAPPAAPVTGSPKGTPKYSNTFIRFCQKNGEDPDKYYEYCTKKLGYSHDELMNG